MEERALTWGESPGRLDNGCGCVEIAALPDRMLIRDAKDPAGPRLAVTRDEWRGFLANLR
ncbi:MAG TPA: DUF397 domain-containing protein [Natronosporangium sp.]